MTKPKAPIDYLFDSIQFKCTVCGAAMGTCTCWLDCPRCYQTVLNNPVHECTGTGKALVCAGSRKEFEEWRRRTGSKGVVYATLKSRAVRNLKPAEWTVVTTSTFWNTPDRGLIMDELERLGFDVARFKL